MCPALRVILIVRLPSRPPPDLFYFFFFNDTATTEIYTLSLHDALPISHSPASLNQRSLLPSPLRETAAAAIMARSEEHTSELQSLAYLVCRLLLEKKKKTARISTRRTRTTSTSCAPSRSPRDARCLTGD